MIGKRFYFCELREQYIFTWREFLLYGVSQLALLCFYSSHRPDQLVTKSVNVDATASFLQNTQVLFIHLQFRKTLQQNLTFSVAKMLNFCQ